MIDYLDQVHFEAFCYRFHHSVELIGRRWSGAIIRAMLGDINRFSEIYSTVPGLSDWLLSERLKELEAEGIIPRTVYPETPVRIEYELTEKGHSLTPEIEAISGWADVWLSEDRSTTSAMGIGQLTGT